VAASYTMKAGGREKKKTLFSSHRAISQQFTAPSLSHAKALRSSRHPWRRKGVAFTLSRHLKLKG
jgi:hypothetical protein